MVFHHNISHASGTIPPFAYVQIMQEAIIAFIAMLTGIVVLASTFSVIGTQMSSVKSSYNVFRQKLDLVQEEMEALAMPPELVFRVDQYYQYLVGFPI